MSDGGAETVRLTNKQREALNVVAHWLGQKNVAPTINDIAAALGLKWKNAARDRVEKLISFGLVERESHSRRSLRLTAAGCRATGTVITSTKLGRAEYIEESLMADAVRRFTASLPVVESNDSCRLWLGRKSNTGYGVLRAFGRLWLAHRLAWFFANGEIPDGMCVCHKCDTPACCNLSHLFLGTKDDNNKDRARKGRSAKGDQIWARKHPEMMSRPGESHALAKLRDADVLKIRSDYTSGVSQSVLASRFGTTQSNISLIVLRKNWRHLKETEQ